MSEITVNIPNIGHNPGTVGWLNEYLEEAEVRVSKNQDGETCLFLHAPKKNGEGLSEDGLFLVKPSNGYEVPPEYNDAKVDGTTFLRTHVTGHPHYEVAWFDIGLTPAAEKRAKAFLDKVTQEFANQWHNDGKEEVPA